MSAWPKHGHTVGRWKAIGSASRFIQTLRNLLVHPKDKRTIGQTGECVYKIPCHNCNSKYKSAITDHVAKENRVIDWSGAKILDREGHRRTRQLKESIRIRKEPTVWTEMRGAYNLPTTYDRILVTRSSSTSRDHIPDEVRRWRTKRRN